MAKRQYSKPSKRSQKPDVAVVDCSLPLVNGIEVTRQIRARLPGTEVLIFTMHDKATLIEELLKAGARGHLRKSDAKSYLIAAIEALATLGHFSRPVSPKRC
jgi:DNA-binding NarL/FixJ family response regulator